MFKEKIIPLQSEFEPLMETQNIEYKESWRDEYLKWICGFANAQGGTLYIGKNDKGEVVGVADAKRLLEDIPNKVSNTLGLVLGICLQEDQGKPYIVINVPSSRIPISYKGAYYLRSGATVQELNGIALQEFFMDKVGMEWDDTVNEQATINDIDPQAVQYFVKHAVMANRMPNAALTDSVETILKNVDVMTPDGKLKNAAIILFGTKPSSFFTATEFKIGRFGNSESDLWFQDVITGNIIQMADRVIESLRSRYLISPIHYEGLQRFEPLEIPETALREAVFNAIIHKNYKGYAIQLKVYNDRLQLWNYGTLPNGCTTEWLLQKHTSVSRNRNIARVFYLAGFIEAWGRGIERMIADMKAAQMEAPEFDANSLGVTVTFYRKKEIVAMWNGNNGDPTVVEKVTKKVTKKVTENQQFIINKLSENPEITVAELSELLGISLRKTKDNMRKLREIGLIRRVGPNRSGHWEVVAE